MILFFNPMLRTLASFLIMYCCYQVLAQYPQYDKNYFLFPIKPGQQNFLAGNMGELRTNHFHGGLDIKTEMRTGLAVLASADGYVSRIAVSSKGYGNTLYITHTNGLTTVYAHLDWFYKDLGVYVKEYLYEQQCNEADFQLAPHALKVTKGDTIAFSGNSGSSAGPHLHWEIRNQKEHLLNPLFFHFPEIKDSQAPFIGKFALRTLAIDSRVEGEFGRIEFTPAKTPSGYQLRYPIHASGWLGLELQTYDRMDATSNLYGVNKIQVKLNGREIFVHEIQQISFDENVYINSHIDYELALTKKSYFQRCYIPDGNCLNTYCADDKNGKWYIEPGKLYQFEVTVWDSHQNSTTLTFAIRGVGSDAPGSSTVKKKLQNPSAKIKLYENIVKVDVHASSPQEIKYYYGTDFVTLPAAYVKEGSLTYLFDARLRLPDSVVSPQFSKSLGFRQVIPTANGVKYYGQGIEVLFPGRSLLDTLYMQTYSKDDLFSVHQQTQPLLSNIVITLKPTKEYTPKSKTHVYQVLGKKSYKFAGGEWKGDQIQFRTKSFGDFTLLTDTIAPKIKYVKSVGKTHYYKVSDNLSGVNIKYAYLNGKFLLMHYLPKYGMLYTDLRSPQDVIKGTLVIVVIDYAGNMTKEIFTY